MKSYNREKRLPLGLCVCLCLCLCLLWITMSNAAPKQRGSDDEDLTHFSSEVHNYLMNFGYLPKSDIETGNLRTEKQLQEAIMNLQRFGNIPQTGVIDAKTRELLRRPRCGAPDFNTAPDFTADNRRHKRFVIQGPKWGHTDLTWSLVNQSMTTPDARQVRYVLTQALNVWARNSRLTFREAYSEHADIQVLFARQHHGDGYDFDGPGFVLAHAFYPGTGRGGDAHFDADETWFLNQSRSSQGTNLMAVAVHEFGHSLGLGHSSVQDAIMFPWYHGYEPDQDLPDDDRLAIQQFYGSKEKQWGPYRPRVTTTTTTTHYPHYSYTNPKPPYYPQVRPRYYPAQTTRRPYVTTTHHPRLYPKDPKTEAPPYPTRHSVVNKPPVYTQKPRVTHHPRHKDHRHRHEEKEKPRKIKPDTCNTDYDAISMIRGELFIFKGQYVWRISDNGIYKGYPHETTRLWSQLPSNFTHVDAVYENSKRLIIFFIGNLYYAFDSNILKEGYPKRLTELGLPASLTHIDAATIWGYNNKTYLYSGTLYWQLDEETGKVLLDYPRDMSIWDGVGYYIDSAFQYKNGKTYFFKGKSFWEFNDNYMRVSHREPYSSAQKWMDCSQTLTNEIDDSYRRKLPLISEPPHHSSSPPLTYQINIILGIILWLLYFIY